MKTITTLVLGLMMITARTICAGSATWRLDPSNGDWNSASNWMPQTVPNGSADVATFDVSNSATLSLSAPTNVKQIAFSPSASAFTISVPGDTLLSFNNTGITNNSGQVQNFAATIGGTNAGGAILFNGTATAGELTHFSITGLPGFTLQWGTVEFHNESNAGSGDFVCNRSTGGDGVGGILQFFDSASAGEATILAQGGDFGSNGGGAVLFNNNSSAADATLTAEGGTMSGGDGGIIDFSGFATADHAVFVANGGAVSGAEGGFIHFTDHSVPAAATFTINGGAVPGAEGAEVDFGQYNSSGATGTVTVNGGAGEGGKCSFQGDASGGGPVRIKISGNGNLTVNNSSNPLVAVGSVEGEGTITVAALMFGIGTNNLDTTFSGVIQSFGNLSKVGAGTLTLTGANTYTGGTNVSAGTLAIDNNTGSGTGTGSVLVNAGMLGGRGIISGAVTVGTGSGTGAFLAPAHGTKKQATLTIQSALTFKSDATYTCAFKARRNQSRNDRVVATGVTIESGASFALLGQAQGVLRQGLTFIVINNTALTPIAGTFSNLPDGAILTVNGNKFQADYEGGDGNDLTLTVVP